MAGIDAGYFRYFRCAHFRQPGQVRALIIRLCRHFLLDDAAAYAERDITITYAAISPTPFSYFDTLPRHAT